MTTTDAITEGRRRPGMWHCAPGFEDVIGAPSFLTLVHRAEGTAFEAFAFPTLDIGPVRDDEWRIVAFRPLTTAGCGHVGWDDPLRWAQGEAWRVLPWGTPVPQEPPRQLGFGW